MSEETRRNTRLPTVVCSTVLRDAQQGEEHGNIYLVDLETEHARKVYSFTDENISWDGRGGDRGLRGIAFYKDLVLVAASDSILFFDREFRLTKRVTNHFLSSCHEMDVDGHRLFISSTRRAAVVVYDLEKDEFVTSYTVRPRWFMVFRPIMRWVTSHTRAAIRLLFPFWRLFWKVRTFDPHSPKEGPGDIDVLHLNNVFVQDGRIYFSGTTLPALFSFSNGEPRPRKEAPIQRQTHNPQIRRNKLLFNATRTDQVVVRDLDTGSESTFSVPRYERETLHNAQYDAHKARQSFARGLTVWKDRYAIAGSSPATVSMYDLEVEDRIKTVQLSKDVREAIHGLELWPFVRT